jgi:hypothetical protein
MGGMSSQTEEPINNSSEHENEGISTSLLEPFQKKRNETFSFPFQTKETSNLSNTQLQRLVLLEQLQVLQMEKEEFICKQDASFLVLLLILPQTVKEHFCLCELLQKNYRLFSVL